jgi:DNA-directed RNA polymerase sigma subunit (sigma70/sigma32)
MTQEARAMNSSKLKIKDYLLCMQQIPPLAEEDLRMAVLARAAGDAWAGRLLEERFLPQVVAWVQPYRGRGLELVDLISLGNRALLRALRQLKPGHCAGAVDFLEACVSAEVEAVVLTRS